MSYPFETIRATLLARSEHFLRNWFPLGKVRGTEFVLGNIQGDAGDSLKISLVKGVGKDFASGDSYGDLIDVYAAHNNISVKEAADSLMATLGIRADQPVRKRPKRPDPSPSNDWLGAWTAAGVETPPHDAPSDPSAFSNQRLGYPDNVYHYCDTDGKLRWVICRWNGRETQRKTFTPYTWSGGVWIPKAPPTPRSLYGLETLSRKGTVIVTEGEKAADAARRLFANCPVVSAPNGAAAVKNADWGELAGRKIVVWADADDAGKKYLEDLMPILRLISDSVRYVDVSDHSDGWDAADWEGSPEEAWAWIKGRLREWANPKVKAEAAAGEAVSLVNRLELWESLGLERKSNGAPYASMDNFSRILTQVWGNTLHYDTFLNQNRIEINGVAEKIADSHVLDILLKIQRSYGIQSATDRAVRQAVLLHCSKNRRNCLQEWLNSLTWDGSARIEQLFVDGFGAPDTQYVRAVGRSFLIGMVARALRAGCQLDTMPILEGAQGIGKTRGIEALAGQEWYADVDATMGSREFIEQIQGKWVVEISELSAMRAGDVEKVKTTLTKTVDVYREPYSTFATDHPRQCVFIGSTNADAYLLDDSGNRRFLPIECSRVDRQWIRENRLQLIAEAVAAFKDGQTWWDIPVDLAKTEQSKREFEDSLVDRIRDYAIFHENINIAEMLNSWQIPPDRQTVAFQRRISSCLRRLGYTRNKSGGLIIWRLEALTLPPRSGAVTPIRRAKVID